MSGRKVRKSMELSIRKLTREGSQHEVLRVCFRVFFFRSVGLVGRGGWDYLRQEDHLAGRLQGRDKVGPHRVWNKAQPAGSPV